MLVNVQMPTRAGILTFMSMTNFVPSRVEHEKTLIIPGPGNTRITEASRH